MTPNGWVALSPLIIVGATIVVIMLVIAFHRDHRLTTTLTMIGLGLGFVALLLIPPETPPQVTALLTLDGYARFFIGLIDATSFIVAALAYDYLRKRAAMPDEFYLLLLLASLGAAVLVASSHFASFFLGLETLSVALYALLAYLRSDERGIEAGLKYLVLAATSAAFLLFGMALVYAATGTMEFARLAQWSAAAGNAVAGNAGAGNAGAGNAGAGNAGDLLMLSGLALIVVGIGFKLAVVPFHLWTPDVYEGAPAPVTAFVATISKGAMFALLLRFFTHVDIHAFTPVFVLFALIAIASMVAGNLLALLQNNVKRILAYSSIAHLGYLLVAFLAGGTMAITAVAFYLVAYFVTTLGAFGIVTVLSGGDRDADRLDDYRGLFWRHPWLAGVFTIMLLSLAGIPLTAGFVGKFYLVAAGVGAAMWLLVIVLVLSSVIGLFYYLRVIVAMGTAPTEGLRAPVLTPLAQLPSRTGNLVLTALTLVLVGLGIYPAPLIAIIQQIAIRLT